MTYCPPAQVESLNHQVLVEDHTAHEISPGKLRQAISYSRAHIKELIEVKTIEIENNMRMARAEGERSMTPNGRNIDLNIINELKRRRMEQRR